MIPICLVTGFLGSGKTTLLKQTVARHADRKLVYLVNELSPLDVDGALLSDAEDDVVAIPGGSIFCKCLVTQFLGYLQQIPERFSTPDAPVEGVVIEASGIANPKVVEQMLADTGLDEVYALATIVSVVDPGSFPKLVHTLPNISAQVEASDLVLINKTDLFDAEQVEATEALVRGINPGAEIIRTVNCNADFPLMGEAHERGITGDYADCLDPNYSKTGVEFTDSIDLDRLTSALRGAAEDIYRAKGFVPTADGLVYLDMSAAGLTVEPSARADVSPGLAIIARGEDSGPMHELQRQIEAGEMSATR